MKSKLKRKYLLLDEWHIEEQEAWFTDMAAVGWQLIRIGKLFAIFGQSSPQNINYRCDIFDPDDPLEISRIKIYEEFGWEHIASRKYIQVFKETEDRKSSEIITDPLAREKTLAILSRDIKKKVGLTILFSTLTVFFQFIALQNDPVGNYLDDGFILFFLSVAIYALVITPQIIGMVQMAKLIKKIKSDSFNGYGINYEWKMLKKVIMELVPTFIIVIAIIYYLANMLTYNSQGEIPRGDLLVVEISDVIDESEYQEIKMTDEGYNYYEEKSSVFVPKQYELHQTVEVVTKSKGQVYSLSIWSRRYESKNEWVAKKLLQKLKEENLNYFKAYKSVSDDRFDELWVRIDGSLVDLDLLARNGNKIYVFSSYDMKPIEEIIEKALIKIKEL